MRGRAAPPYPRIYRVSLGDIMLRFFTKEILKFKIDSDHGASKEPKNPIL